jgi:hypothetical protein
MTDGLRALLEGAIDYAGLFPPARLGLDEAVRNYARYRQEADAWMLGRFVVPAARLEELSPYVDTLFASGPPLSVAVLGRGGNTMPEWTAGLREDAQAIAAWRMRHGGRVRIGVFETRLADASSAAACVKAAADILGPTPPSFFECPLGGEDAPSCLPPLVHEIAARGGGVKLRCGGLTAAAFPTPGQIVFALRTCRGAWVPVKLTAGLHHPLPRFDPGVQATMHGFVNVLAAGVFAGRLASPLLIAAQLAALLQDANPAHFSFTGGIAWQGLSISATEVARDRRQAILSFGSCSFDEPREDLRSLGWL